MKQEAIFVVSRHSQEEGFVGWDEVCHVIEAVWLSMGIVSYRERFDDVPCDGQQLQLVCSSGRGEAGGVEQDVCGNTWKMDKTHCVLCCLGDVSEDNR